MVDIRTMMCVILLIAFILAAFLAKKYKTRCVRLADQGKITVTAIVKSQGYIAGDGNERFVVTLTSCGQKLGMMYCIRINSEMHCTSLFAESPDCIDLMRRSVLEVFTALHIVAYYKFGKVYRFQPPCTYPHNLVDILVESTP